MSDKTIKDLIYEGLKQLADDPKLVARSCFSELEEMYGPEVALAAFEAITTEVRDQHPHLKTPSVLSDLKLLQRMLREGADLAAAHSFTELARMWEKEKNRDALRRRLDRVWQDHCNRSAAERAELEAWLNQDWSGE